MHLSLGAYPQQESERFVQAEVVWSSVHSQDVRSQGIAWEDGIWKGPAHWQGPLATGEVKRLREAGAQVTILIDDLTAYYQQRNREARAEAAIQNTGCAVDSFYGLPWPDPQGFTLGSMGGYFTLEEIYAHLDTMASRFPNLITARSAIDTFQTHEGRPIYYVKISDNPGTNEGEPAVLLTALHHAREPASASQLIYFMYSLLEGYASNPAIQWLVDHTEIYIIPCVNPDGYYYNQQQFPLGGGMWRKNRRNNGNGIFGVDLNRNYGLHWGYDNTGSSGNPSSQVYRGPGPFSEPETRAVRALCLSDTFLIALNYHTYSNLLIYPWGFAADTLTPDSTYYESLAREMTRHNHYVYGTGDQTVGYIVNGDSDDWMYGDSSKNKILAMTPEVGSPQQGFWPPASDILGLCRQTRWMNLITLLAVHSYAVFSHVPPLGLTGSTGYLHYGITPLGLQNDSAYVQFFSLSPLLSIDTTRRAYGMNGTAATYDDSVSYAVSGSPSPGTLLQYGVQRQFGMYVMTDTYEVRTGIPATLFTETFANTAAWNTGSWGLTSSTFHSAPYSITESPAGPYPNSQTFLLTLTNPIDLTNASEAWLSFWARWHLESNYDYVYVEVKEDGASTWQPLCGGDMVQNATIPGYTGHQDAWTKQVLALTDWTGHQINLRFRFESDPYVQDDGFYLDDVSVLSFTSTPTHIAPQRSDRLKVWARGHLITGIKPPTAGHLILTNITGQTVAQRTVDAGRHFRWNVAIPAGVYVVTFQGKDETHAALLTITR